MKKIIKTLLVVMVVALALTVFTACNQPEAPDCDHNYKQEFLPGKDPTCTEDGLRPGYKCSNCGEVTKEQVVVPAYHRWVEADCTNPKTCALCEETEGEALGHSFTKEVEAQAPTCDKIGYTAHKTCDVCGEPNEEYVESEALGHAWGEPFVYAPATCTEAGIMAVECGTCGGKAKYADIPAGHNVGEDGVCTGCGYVPVATAEELIAALEAGKKVLLTADITMDATLKCPYGNAVGVAQKGGEFNGNGHTLTVNGSGNYYAIITYGGTIANLTINSGFRAVVTYTPTEDVVLDNVTIEGDNICYGFNTAELTTLEGIDLVVKNSTICGWVSFNGGFESVNFENCNFVQGTYYDNVFGRLVKPYVSTTFTNCTFVTNAYLDLCELLPGETVVLTGCKVGDVDVTVDVFTTTENDAEKPFTYEAPAGVELVLETVEGGVSFHRHGYEAQVTAPTCTAAGKTVYTCACGATYEEAGEVALGHADENGDFKCDICTTKVLPADGTTLTITQALAIAKLAGTSYTTQKYYITGTIKNVYNTTYGNMYIVDSEGNELCIYGLYTWDKAVRYDKMEYKPVAGDEVTVYTVLGAYGTTYQGKDAWLDDVVAHEHNYVAVVTEPGCLTEGYTTHTCSICSNSYVDSETEALGHTTEAGTCERCGNEIGGSAPVVGTLATFDFGANGSASHVDGNDLGTSKSYTVGSYTLALTGMSKVYGPAYDAKGNSCIKLGTSKLVGTFSFTVPENVTEVVIYVAKYKSNSTTIKVNGTSYTLTKNSNDGAYDVITIDTTTTKTVTLTTVSSTYRAMVNSIVFNGYAQ